MLPAPSVDQFLAALFAYREARPHTGVSAFATWYLRNRFLAYAIKSQRPRGEYINVAAYHVECLHVAWNIPATVSAKYRDQIVPVPRCGNVTWIWRYGIWMTGNREHQRHFVEWVYGAHPIENASQ